MLEINVNDDPVPHKTYFGADVMSQRSSCRLADKYDTSHH